MADKTQNFGLTKPLASEFYDVAVQNGNMDKIDAALQEHDQHAKDATLHVTAAEKASWNGKAEPGEIADAVNAHNTGQAAHPDMRTAIEAAQSAADAAHAHTGVAVTGEAGVHGLRVYDGKLQMWQEDGSWADASASGGLMPQIHVTTEPEAAVRCTMGDTILEAVAGTDGLATIEIPEYGTWEVRVEKSGYSPNQTVVDVDTCKVYNISLEFFRATITVTTRPNASVHAVRGGMIMRTIADSTGIAVFRPSLPGAYNVSASVTGSDMAIVSSKTVTVTVENGGSYNVVCPFIELTVHAESGSTVQAARGETRMSSLSVDGKTTFLLPSTGVWTITATNGSKIKTASISVSGYDNYTIILEFSLQYGVHISKSNPDPEAGVTYIGDAAGHASGYDAWKDDVIVGAVKPCATKDGKRVAYLNPDNFAQKSDGTALDGFASGIVDIMIRFPNMGYKIEPDAYGLNVWVTDAPNEQGFCYYAHSFKDENDCAAVYLGAYIGTHRTGGLYSISGVAPTANMTLKQARTYAQARGENYGLVGFFQLTLSQCLYLLIYKNLNGQTALGYGYSPGSSASGARNTGGTDTKGMCYGTGNNTDQVKFLGMEDFWGNLHWWIDGIYCNADYGIQTAWRDFDAGGENYPFLTETSLAGLATESGAEGWISGVVGCNEGGFCANELAGSSSTFYCDNAKFVSEKHAYFGGNWNYGLSCGPFRLVGSFGENASGVSIGARLMMYELKEIM